MKGRPRNAKIPKIITKGAVVVRKHLFLELQVSFPALPCLCAVPIPNAAAQAASATSADSTDICTLFSSSVYCQVFLISL